MGPTGHERRRGSADRRGDAALLWEPHVEAFIGHGYGPNSDGSARLPWFLSLRAGGDTPPRRASAVRTIRLFNKGIGNWAKAGPGRPPYCLCMRQSRGGRAGCPNAVQPGLGTVSTPFLRPPAADSKQCSRERKNPACTGV